eukprot:6213752-Pleurochrysis_carterae.AAC.3
MVFEYLSAVGSHCAVILAMYNSVTNGHRHTRTAGHMLARYVGRRCRKAKARDTRTTPLPCQHGP